MSFQVAALAGATLLSAGSQIAGGFAQARGQRSLAGQYAMAQQESKVQTLQEEVARRRRLMDMTASNALDLAGRNVTSDSGSYEAIEEENRRQADIDISAARYMGESRQRQLGLAARNANKAASSAIRQGFIGAGASLLSGAWQGFRGMSGSPDTGGNVAGTQAYGNLANAAPSMSYGGPR